MFKVQLVDTPSDRQIAYDLRHAVFVIEQDIPEEFERDELDETEAFHFLGYIDDTPMATARVVVHGTEAQIGRVCISLDHRGKNYGHELMESIMSHIETKMDGIETLFLHARDNVIKFYEDLGFFLDGERFIEVDIVHVPMRYKIKRGEG